MKRRLLTTLAWTSLLLCLTTAVFWIRGYWRCDFGYMIVGARTLSPGSANGEIDLVWRSALQGERTFDSATQQSKGYDFLSWCDHHVLGFGLGYRNSQILVLPDWFLILLFGLPPAWYLFRREKRAAHRARLGLCLRCGYDLRATPYRCPECGTIPKTAANPECSSRPSC